MSDELSQRLRKISESMKTLQDNMQQELEQIKPSSLSWDSFLEQLPILSIHFSDVLKEITPMLSNFVVYPTKLEPPEAPPKTSDFLSTTEISELASENESCRQRFIESAEKLGLNNKSQSERLENLTAQLGDHNMICEKSFKLAQELIQHNRLIEKNSSYMPVFSPKPPPFDLLDAMMTGKYKDRDVLQPPPNLGKR